MGTTEKVEVSKRADSDVNKTIDNKIQFMVECQIFSQWENIHGLGFFRWNFRNDDLRSCMTQVGNYVIISLAIVLI